MDLDQSPNGLTWPCACLLTHHGDADNSLDGDRYYAHVLPSQPHIRLQASRQRLIALPARTSILPITEHLLWVHSWCSNWRLSDFSTNVAATSTPPKRKSRDSKVRAWVFQAGACLPLARTTWAFMLRWIALNIVGHVCKGPLRSL